MNTETHDSSTSPGSASKSVEVRDQANGEAVSSGTSGPVRRGGREVQNPLFALLLIALGSELIYAFYFVRHFPLLHYYSGDYIDMGGISNMSHLEFWLFILEFALLLTICGTAAWMVRDIESSRFLWLILGVGAIFAVTMTFVYPVTANDVFSYIDHSLVIVQYHQNPISVPPGSFPKDPLMRLSGGWAAYGSPYGPLGLVINALPTLVVRRNLLANLILLKLMFSAMTLLSAYLVYLLLQQVQPRFALAGAILVAWNPLILFETSANAHNDIAMMSLVLLALLFMAEGSYTIGPVILVASALVKYASIILLPLLLIHALSRQGSLRRKLTYSGTTGAAILAVIVVPYIPFWAGFDTFRRPLLENNFYLYSFGSVLHNLFLSSVTLDEGSFIGRLLFVPIYLYCLWLAKRDLAGLLQGCFIVVFSFLALVTNNVKAWYAIWPVVLGPTVIGIQGHRDTGEQRDDPQRPTPSLQREGGGIAIAKLHRARSLTDFTAAAIVLSVLLLAFAAEVAVALNIYVWRWEGATIENLRPINNASYVLLFVLPAVIGAWGLWEAGMQGYREAGKQDGDENGGP